MSKNDIDYEIKSGAGASVLYYELPLPSVAVQEPWFLMNGFPRQGAEKLPENLAGAGASFLITRALHAWFMLKGREPLPTEDVQSYYETDQTAEGVLPGVFGGAEGDPEGQRAKLRMWRIGQPRTDGLRLPSRAFSPIWPRTQN